MENKLPVYPDGDPRQLITQIELEALASLTDDQKRRLFAGEAIRTPSGVTLELASDPTAVAGTKFGILRSRRPEPKKDAVVERTAAANAAQQALRESLNQHEASNEVRRAVVAYDLAVRALTASLGDLIKSQELDLRRATELAAALPSGLASGMAQAKARAKHKGDPKQAAKAGALKLWQERHAGKHKSLRTVEQYAIEVMRRWPILTSAKVICGWSAGWTKDVREGRTPAC